MDNINRISDRAEYYVTFEDIINQRDKTVGEQHVEFIVNNLKVKLYDVGGEKPERLNWDTFLGHVDAIVWIASLSEYDQSSEDQCFNKLTETLHVLQNVWRSSNVLDLPVYFLFTKMDTFAKKIVDRDLTTVFPVHEVPQTLRKETTQLEKKEFAQQSIQFLQKKFAEALHETKITPNKIDMSKYGFVLNALDTKQVQASVTSIIEALLQQRVQAEKRASQQQQSNK